MPASWEARRRSTLLVLAAASFLSVLSFVLVLRSGTVLYIGDAVAHLNIARKVVDNKTPGWAQIGTVWLPLPHVLTALTVWIDPLWRSGIAGALPSLAGFVIGALFLFRIVERELESRALAWASLAIYGLNFNLLYLQSTPMNEPQMIAEFLGAVFFALNGRAVPAGLWLLAGTLTRYEGWFYIPFFAAYFWWKHGFRRAVVFGAIASTGPLLWLIHNQVIFGNVLEWYNGPYSAAAIEARTSPPTTIGPRHPGDGAPWIAILYYWKSARLAVGNLPAWLAVAGAALLWLRRRVTPPLLLLWLPLVFYTLSIAYGSVPVFIPEWPPFSYYNTRYALEILPAIAAFAPAAAACLIQSRLRAALILALYVAAGWTLGYSRAGAGAAIVFREAEENSRDRRYAVAAVGRELSRGCREIWMASGDLNGALLEAGIPFRRVILEGSPNLHPEQLVDCVVSSQGDSVNEAIAKLPSFEQSFRVVLDLTAPGVPRVKVWRKLSVERKKEL